MSRILAVGGDSKPSLAMLIGGDLTTYAPAGSLSDPAVYRQVRALLAGLIREWGGVEVIACDLHPDYRSTILAAELLAWTPGARVMRIPHHFAHMASGMYDHGLDTPVIGVAFDGTGYGTDGVSWGGEILCGDRRAFTRAYHLEYLPMPGGDRVARDGWRMAAAYLCAAYGVPAADAFPAWGERIGKKQVAAIQQMIDRRVQCPRSSSAGRLFDAVASLAGICDRSVGEADAAIALERAATEETRRTYPFDIHEDRIIVTGLIRAVVEDVRGGVAVGTVSAVFHETLAEIIVTAGMRLHEQRGLTHVVLSGGCFLNKRLLRAVTRRAEGTPLSVLSPQRYAPSDASLAVGQAVVAQACIEEAVLSAGAR